MLTKRHSDLLEARGLDIELMERYGVESFDRGDFDGISIPYLENGAVVNHKRRSISGVKRFEQDKDARKVFWNQDVLSDHTLDDHPLVITEGEMDAFAAIQAGFLRTLSVPDGAPAQAIGEQEDGRKYSYLIDALKLLSGISPIILATDGDGPGINLMNDLSLRLGKGRCKWLIYPKGCKDLNDALAKYGQRGVVETLNRAQWCKVDGIYRMSELPPISTPKGLDCGLPGLHKHYRLRPGDFCVITGIPSHGKSAFVNDVACRMVAKHHWPVAFASFEQKPQIDHRRNLRTYFNDRWVIDQSPEMIANADAWIDKWFTFLVPDEDDDVTLEWVLERCAAAILQNGCKLVVVDPWNEMDHIRPPDMTLTEYTGFAIKQFKKLAAKYAVHLIVVAHPAKMRREGNTTPVPTLYDISDSAHWANKPDVGVIVHRQGADNTDTLIRVQKSRYHDEIGEPGDLTVRFDKQSFHYREIVSPLIYAEEDAA